ncbi:MAG: PQQ-like beta-propeller repeat protein [Planctomycetes bacterium]|nr:PQQ-like beta-propeller repeat protein [Planctomycetota bacterium]
MDERLRDLERAARARPDDRGAGWALARALEQAGDRTGAWRALCALARAGDDAAWDALDRRPAGLRRAPEVAAEARWPREGVPALGAALEDAVVLFDGHDVVALEPLDLAERWRVRLRSPHPTPAALCGPVVACVGRRLGRGPELVVIEGATGRVVGRSRLGHRGAEDRGISATADRLVARTRDGGGGSATARVFDALDEAPLAEDTVVLPASPGRGVRGRLISRFGQVLTARPLEGGDPLWTANGSVLHADDRGLLVARSGPAAPEAHAVELDLASGRPRWVRPRDAGSGPALLTQDVAVLAHERGGLTLVALDRADGAERWRRSVGGGRCSVHDVVAARDVVYVVAVFTADERRFEAVVLAFDLATGEPLFRHRLADEHTAPRLALVALDKAVAVIASRRDGTRVTRLA